MSWSGLKEKRRSLVLTQRHRLVNASEGKAGTNQLVNHRKLVHEHFTSQDMQDLEKAMEKYSTRLGSDRCFRREGQAWLRSRPNVRLLGGNNLNRK